MAWRIHDSVIRGEIDNREKNIVRGKVWLNGVPEPVLLELKGNACADLAGCLLSFENTKPTIPMRPDANFWKEQRGGAGDITASRKVRVFDMPIEEAYPRLKKKLPVPEHMANCLYIEWFSHRNGRVVIESTDCTLNISAPEWRLSEADEQRRQSQAGEGFNMFMQQLSAAIEAQRHEPPEDKEWDEFDYEKFMRESDARTDKYAELLEKYMDHPERDKIIAKEMGWTWLEEALEEEEQAKSSSPSQKQEGLGDDNDDDAFGPLETDSDEEEGGGWEVPDNVDELADELKPDPTTEGVDWVRDEHGSFQHPLCLRAQSGAMDLWHKCDELGLDKATEPDLSDLLSEYQITSAKLAGALNSLAYGRHLRDGPFTVAYLKRALNYLHSAQAALERVFNRKLLPKDITDRVRKELFGIREEILKLMQEFRNQ
jgi:hypothetical protein